MSSTNVIERTIERCSVLLVDDNQYSRKLTRMLLANIGIKKVHEATDGIAGLEAIRSLVPDIVMLDWEMPLLNGAELVRIVRSPGVFPTPDVPIIIVSGYGERWRVHEAMRLGVHEFLVKPVSAKALRDRVLSIVVKPRQTIQFGEYYGPEPRGRFAPGLPPGAADASTAVA
jgi:two-component system, chemotaxis family, chemotaxis protein CheY